jgi:hypothetical protein
MSVVELPPVTIARAAPKYTTLLVGLKPFPRIITVVPALAKPGETLSIFGIWLRLSVVNIPHAHKHKAI